jgi:hypothetical protein
LEVKQHFLYVDDDGFVALIRGLRADQAWTISTIARHFGRAGERDHGRDEAI